MLLRASFFAAFSLAFTAVNARAICASNYAVVDTTSTGTAGLVTYSFSVIAGCNTSNAFYEFYVPYFSDAGIANITVPSGWSDSVSSIDLLGLGSETLIFAPSAPLVGLQYGTTITGISFTSPYGPVDGPLGISQGPLSLAIDPLIPGSPDTIAALNGTAAPEPSTVIFGVIGVLSLAAFALKQFRFA